MITNGALHALCLALEVVGQPGDRVLVESPTYPNAFDAIPRQGLSPVPVAIDAARPDALAGDMQAAARSTRARIAYVIPDFQNPTGMLLDTEQRRRLVASLADAGTIAIADESVADLCFEGTLPPPLAAFGREDAVLTVGSMSKPFWGGLRMGWVRASESVARTIMNAGAARHLSLPVFEQLVACHLLDDADVILAERRTQLRKQRDSLVAAIGSVLPEWEVRLARWWTRAVVQGRRRACRRRSWPEAAPRMGSICRQVRGSVRATPSMTGSGCRSHIRSTY